MTEVNVKIDDISYVYYLLDELKKHGYEKNQDFEWSFVPMHWDSSTNISTDKSVTFAFKNDTTASWFLLKYGTQI